VTASGGLWDERQVEYLLRPDPAHPDLIFLDDDFAICVRTLPAATPVWLDYTPYQDLSMALLALPLWWASARIDPRWKVITFRQPRRRPSIPRVIGLEFCDTEEAADARRVEMLGSRQAGQSVGRPAIKTWARGRERRRGRLESSRGSAGPGPEPNYRSTAI
jgi:hypothetical protein